MTLLQDLYLTGAKRLRQWARVGVGRLTGSVSAESGTYKAVISMEEARLFHRAELTALGQLLVEKGLVTRDEITSATIDEMNELEKDLAKSWPEIEVAPDGTSFSIKDLKGFAARARREGWPP